MLTRGQGPEAKGQVMGLYNAAIGAGSIAGSFLGAALFEYAREQRAEVGETLSFEARSPGGPLNVKWSSTADQVVKPIQASIFWAAAVGKAQVCAQNRHRRVCTTVEVLP